jgi:hypothetical protein
MLAGRAAEVASVLAYMVGAGVGEIRLQLPANQTDEQELLIGQASRLNPEVVVRTGPGDIANLDLIFAIGDDPEKLEQMLVPWLLRTDLPLIFVCADEPAYIATFGGRPPCPLCAGLPTRSKRRSDIAGFVTMVAATEAFKLLAGITSQPSPLLLQFIGFACTPQPLRQKPLRAKCACATDVEAN